MIFHHFVDPVPKVEIFEKEGETENEVLILKWDIEVTLPNCNGGWRKFHAESVFLYIFSTIFFSTVSNVLEAQRAGVF